MAERDSQGVRGPDYAGDLTRPERQTLDLLLSEVDWRTSVQKRRWGHPVAAGLMAALVLLAGAVVRLWPEPAPQQFQVAASPGPTPDTAARLAELAAAAANAPTAAVPERFTRETLHIFVQLEHGTCRVSALSVALVLSPEPTKGPTAAKYRIEAAQPPPGAAGLGGCPVDAPVVPPTPVPDLTYNSTADLAVDWDRQQKRLSALGYGLGPPGIRADFAAALTHVPTTVEAERWWRTLVDVGFSPYLGAELRAAALRTAAAWVEAGGDARYLPDRTRDLLGRPAVAFRAYEMVLLFEPTTGRLSQAEVPGDGLGITIRLPPGQVPWYPAR